MISKVHMITFHGKCKGAQLTDGQILALWILTVLNILKWGKKEKILSRKIFQVFSIKNLKDFLKEKRNPLESGMEYQLLIYISDIKENGKRLFLKEQQQYVKRLKKIR